MRVNLFSFSHIVSSHSSFNIHNALYFVKYPSRAAQIFPRAAGVPRVEDPWPWSKVLTDTFCRSSYIPPCILLLVPLSGLECVLACQGKFSLHYAAIYEQIFELHQPQQSTVKIYEDTDSKCCKINVHHYILKGWKGCCCCVLRHF